MPSTSSAALSRAGHWSRILPLALLVLLLAVTFAAWRAVHRGSEAKAQASFADRSHDVTERVTKRLQEHQKLLLGGVGLFNSVGDVTRTQWRQFVSALELDQNHPGIQGVGFSIWLSPAQKAANIRAIRAEGYPEYAIKPEGDRSVYTSIIYLEPFNWRNQRAFGYDMYSEPLRRTALDLAKDSGLAQISGKITLVQETERDKQNGILMYVPVYQTGHLTDTVEHRRDALIGFVYSPIRMDDFIFGTMGKLSNDIAFELRDSTSQLADASLFSSTASEPVGGRPVGSDPLDITQAVDVFNGHRWTFSFRRLPAFDASVKSADAVIVLVSGISLSFLLSFIAFSSLSVRRQALSLAATKTKELALSEEFLRLILNSAAEAIYGIDTQGNCTFCNQACLNLLGYASADELLGRNMHDVCHYAHVSGAPYPVEDCQIYRAFRFNEPSHCETEVFFRKDGRSLPVEYWSYPQLRDGMAVGAVVTFLDITERRASEHALVETSTRLSLASRAGGVGIWDYDLVADTLAWDDQMLALYGISAEQFSGAYQAWQAGVHPDDRARSDREIVRAIAGDEEFNTEFRVMWPDGSVHNIRARATVQRDAAGRAVRMIGTNWDITDQKKAEEQAQAASRAKSEFLANMSHEIRTPLNGVIAMSSLLLETRLDPEQRQCADIVQSSGEALLALINDILDLSKVEAGKLQLEHRVFSMAGVIAGIETSFAASAKAKGLTLLCHLETTVPQNVYGDAARITQVLTNLVGNAIKFTSAGHVTVRVDLESETATRVGLRCTVADTGIGIAPDKIGLLFESFSQTDASNTRKFGGTGLGLSISKQLVQAMGGQIGVRSEPDHGSEFFFSLTLEKGTAVAILAAPAPVGVVTFSADARLLVVEDNVTNLIVIRALLAKLGLTADVATNGREAVALVEHNSYDLVLMDIQMPVMDGLEATRRIRQMADPGKRATPIVAVTANAMKEDREVLLQAGMNDCLFKPIDVSALVSALRQWLVPVPPAS